MFVNNGKFIDYKSKNLEIIKKYYANLHRCPRLYTEKPEASSVCKVAFVKGVLLHVKMPSDIRRKNRTCAQARHAGKSRIMTTALIHIKCSLTLEVHQLYRAW